MLVAGNWKSNKSFNEAREFAHAFSKLPGASEGVEVMIAPPAPYLAAMGADPLPFRLGSQNVSATGPGARYFQKSLNLKDLGQHSVKEG